MSNFADLLKEARTGRVQVFHEFLTNYDPSKSRLHCFFEGRDDEIFYRHFIAPRTKARLFVYVCGSKDEVYAVFASIAGHPGCPQCLFFVDKDLSDLLREPRPKHKRLFVTGYYSIENYLVVEDVFIRFCRDFIQCRGVRCDHEAASGAFHESLQRFYKMVLPIMAWIVAVRRRGQRPNVRNLQLRQLFRIGADLQVVKTASRARTAHLCRATGVPVTPGIARDIRSAARELQRHEPKMIVRGKFEAWFFVEYIKALAARLRDEAEVRGGTVTINPPVEHSSFVPLAVPSTPLPNALEHFLAENL